MLAAIGYILLGFLVIIVVFGVLGATFKGRP